ncbi:hypothetical protein MesoLjLc_05430 [Mesorhizobium sp. L-8-10]|nr:hypothetical protein MesoLjLc_05430 [Mesorhizobium sp. L-8-10]
MAGCRGAFCKAGAIVEGAVTPGTISKSALIDIAVDLLTSARMSWRVEWHAASSTIKVAIQRASGCRALTGPSIKDGPDVQRADVKSFGRPPGAVAINALPGTRSP